MTVTQEFIEILILLIILGTVYGIFSIFCVLEFFGSRNTRPKELSGMPIPISILKPVKGADSECRENLRSFCRQNYPEHEVLIGFTEPADDALSVAREIVSSSDCSARTVISQKRFGGNPKVSNLYGLVEAAAYPLVAISDSDMRVDDTYLNTIVAEYQSEKNVGVVTSLYKVSDPKSIGAALESLTIALDFIPSVLVARRLEGITFGLGASMLLSKKALEDIGGLSAIADYLADDYQISHRLWERGFKNVLSHYLIENVVGDMSVADYLVHQARWARACRTCRPIGFFGYGITHIFALSFLLLILQGVTTLTLSVISAVLILRVSLAVVLHRKVIGSRNWLKCLLLLPIKDLMSFGTWLWSFLGRKVFWRGKYYTITEDGRIKSASPQ